MGTKQIILDKGEGESKSSVVTFDLCAALVQVRANQFSHFIMNKRKHLEKL